MGKKDGLIVKIVGAVFNVPHFIKQRGNRYAQNTTHSFKSHANDKAKEMRKKGWSVVIKTQTAINNSGKSIKAYTTYIRRKKK